MKRNNTLFIVDSPFQCLCLIEAVNYFKVTDFDVIVAYCNNNSLDKVDRLLNDQGIPYKKLWLSHLLYDTIPLLFKKHKKYKRFFIGNFCSPHSYALSVLYAQNGASIYFMDDGTQILSLFSDKPSPKKANWKVDTFMGFINILHHIKMMKRDVFFTIYNVVSEKYDIIRNPFNSLVAPQNTTLRGVYIIGTNTGIVKFKGVNYESLLKGISEKYKGMDIYYCPHRQDPYNDNIFSYCKDIGINIFDTSVSVEYDFIKNAIYPAVIIGFNSNALYTLHQIFPKALCLNVAYEVTDTIRNEATSKVREEMKKAGIEIIYIDNH